jgi:hypothetical protein
MKLKLNLNVDSAKRLLIQHGEKAAFGLAVCVLLLFFWKTLKLEVLGADKEPGPLTTLAEKARQHVLTSVWDPDAKNIKIVDYPARAEHVPLNVRDYDLVAFYDKPLWDQHEKRPVPKVLPVEELVAATGQAILAVKKEADDAGKADAPAETHAIAGAAGSKGHGAQLGKELMPKGFFYVAVTGLVPVRKQIAAYDDAFRGALKYDAARDVPGYGEIKVERADVTGVNPARAAWKEIDMAAVGNFVGTWSTESINDVVDDEYLGEPYTYTMPLGPLLGEDWDPAVAGHPKIPPAERLAGTKKPEKAAATSTADRGVGWGSRKPPPKATGAAAKPNPPPQAVKPPAGSKREQKLFRFVDYKVEPGRQYRYRVKLTLQNPNQEVADRFLKEPALSHTPTLETAWSEPSPVVTVPRGFSIFAGPVLKPTPSPSRDPEVEICVLGFDRQRGGEPAVKKTVQRGTLLNFSEKGVKVMTPDRKAISKWEKVDILSNTLIVDVQGGRKLSQTRKALVEPVEILVLDADGRASVHDELDDAAGYHARLDPLDQVETQATTKPDKNPYEKETRKPRGGANPPSGDRPATSRPRRPPGN